jgi:hypothetical protein
MAPVESIALSYFLGTIISFLLSVPSFIAAALVLPSLFKLELSISQLFFTWIIVAMLIVLMNYIGLSYALNHELISREFINMSVPSFLSILFPILLNKSAFYKLREDKLRTI